MKKCLLFFRQLFSKTAMPWKRVICISLLCGLSVGVIMLLDPLDGTSFQQPGITFEFWILAALFIIMNCTSGKEAGLKTFVFFLISQPLIYLVQVPFSSLGWGIFIYYPRWGLLTLATLPGGWIAWQVKKQNWLAVFILSVATGILCFSWPVIYYSMTQHFPKLVLAVLFILLEIVFLIVVFLEDRKKQLLGFALAVVMLVSGILIERHQRIYPIRSFSYRLPGSAPYEIVSVYSDIDMHVEDGYLFITMPYHGSLPIEIMDGEGRLIQINFSYFADEASWQLVEGE